MLRCPNILGMEGIVKELDSAKNLGLYFIF